MKHTSTSGDQRNKETEETKVLLSNRNYVIWNALYLENPASESIIFYLRNLRFKSNFLKIAGFGQNCAIFFPATCLTKYQLYVHEKYLQFILVFSTEHHSGVLLDLRLVSFS